MKTENLTTGIEKPNANHTTEKYSNNNNSSVDGFRSRRSTTQERINELEDRTIENTQLEREVESESLRNLWDDSRCANIHIREVSGQAGESRAGKY